jgi:hypothetical protein
MAERRDPGRERIPVAAPRPRQPRPRRRRSADASGAGLTLIVVIVALTILGDLAGQQIGLHIAGALIGGFAGLILGFTAIYWRYRNL